jgi:hypothetical protein
MLLADHEGMLATTVVSDWVLERLEQLDPQGEFLPVPAAQGPCGSDLASVTRLPVMSEMSGMQDMQDMAEASGMLGRHAAAASVLQLRVPVGADD